MASHSPYRRPQVVNFKAVENIGDVYRDGFFCVEPVDKDQRAALCGGLLSNQQAMSACCSSASLAPVLPGYFFEPARGR